MRKVSVPAETAETTVCAKWSPSEFWSLWNEFKTLWNESKPCKQWSVVKLWCAPQTPLQSWRSIFPAVGCAAGGQPSSGIALAKERDTSFLPRSHKVTHPSQVSPYPMTYQSLMTEVKWSESLSVMSNSLQHHGLYNPWNSPGQNTGVGSLSLLQGLMTDQGYKTEVPCPTSE